MIFPKCKSCYMSTTCALYALRMLCKRFLDIHDGKNGVAELRQIAALLSSIEHGDQFQEPRQADDGHQEPIPNTAPQEFKEGE